jgi:hypothetical protein
VNAADENKVAPAVEAMMNDRMIDFSCVAIPLKHH